MTHVLKMSGGSLQNVLTLKFWSLEVWHSDNQNQIIINKTFTPKYKEDAWHTTNLLQVVSFSYLVFH